MSNAIDAPKLAALALALPGRIRAATQAMLDAERRLTDVLMLRATGQPVKRWEISHARMALARTQREVEDLQRIQSVLPELVKQARESRQAEPVAKAV